MYTSSTLWYRFISALCMGFMIIVGLSAQSHGEEGVQVKTERTIESANKRWQKNFGKVDFTEKRLFERMAYLHPQPESRFKPFSVEALSDAVQMNHSLWVKILFKGALLEAFADSAPVGYYLNNGGREPSLLLYKVDDGQVQYSIQENFNVVFLTIKPKDFNPASGVEGSTVIKMLAEWTNIGGTETKGPAWEPDLSGRLNVGSVFSNHKDAHIQRITDWRRDIAGFVSEHGISILFFKVQPDIPRARVGLAYDFDWLNKGLLKQNRKTFVDKRFSPEGLKTSGKAKKKTEQPSKSLDVTE